MSFEKARKWENEMLACTRCGYCMSSCPTFEPVGWDSSTPRSRVMLSYGLMAGDLEADGSVVKHLYQCTTCAHCEEACPSLVKIVDVIEAARQDLFQSGNGLEKHGKLVEGIVKYGNPYWVTEPRSEMFQRRSKQAEVAYFIGCTAAYREQDIAEASISILDKLGIDFTLLDEVCCGSPLRRVGGSDEEFEKLVMKNIEAIASTGAKKVVFTCAGCYRMFRKEYPEVADVPFETQHIVEFLMEREMEFSPAEMKVAYHDPCHLGRHLGVYDEPRQLLARVPGLELVEMDDTREHALCCGGGGGVRAGFGELSQKVAEKRMEGAGDVDKLVTACPFCVSNLRKGAEGRDDLPEVVDLVVFLKDQIAK